MLKVSVLNITDCFVTVKCIIFKTLSQCLYVSSHIENLIRFTDVCFVVGVLKCNGLVQSSETGTFKHFGIILPSFPLYFPFLLEI
jgi:hypothetical protein